MRPFTKVGLGAVTATTMATSTFPIIVASVLAAQLLEEFDISRTQVGLLVTASGLVGALVSPALGRLTDKLGAVRSIIWTLSTSAVTLTALALSPDYELLFAAAVLTGLPNGWGNSATNALIVDNVAAGVRGVVTGVKQSGVQIGTFLGGLLLPLFTLWWNWRVAVLIFLAMPAAALIAMVGRHDPSRHHTSETILSQGKLPKSVTWIAVYGFASGLGSSAIIGFLPLFAEEDQLWSKPAAGTILATVGLTGIVGRILWSRWSERSLGHGRTLRILAWLTTGTSVLLALASLEVTPSWALIPAAVLLGGGAVAWNAVGMLAVMEISPPGLVGKSTGAVLFGFLFGLALGPPLMGFSVDTLGTYTPGWLATAALMAISGLIAFKIPEGVTIADS